jgi:ubiquinone/menaquinone biosynthesis C-methylase UbiE
MFKSTGGNALLDVNYILNKASIEAEEKVADLGCGTAGHYIFSASNLVGERGVVYAVDILKPILENIKKRAEVENIKNIITVWSDLEVFGATKIESSSLDRAFLINTLYQSRKRVEIMRESVRMIKKHGKLLIVEWSSAASSFGPLPKERVKKDLLLEAGKKFGLQMEEEFIAGDYHYGLLFEKL